MENKKILFEETEHRRDYLSVDGQYAISAHGEIFKIGDVVKHESEDPTETAIIKTFSLDTKSMDIVASTTKGNARICFIYK